MSLEADGMITIYDIETGVIIAQYEGLEVHEAMLAMKAAFYINREIERYSKDSLIFMEDNKVSTITV